ncbi:phospholipase A2 inhibitor and Ly6/PLAUR domain-containing protein-like isoform X2 [Xenopus laevis]|uniref:Phospholipase A2 inhibitor and Ly6/PLAUR domain-containing protein-like isoform X2 n=1 Tax=Xenopus laevis TaxID=8355 RepID=A0A8J1L807_XENLA|nr:phospholipase A2 inhibitor and Ly6/PLAUR domain-containing protein-like isoform X2 [Xenopus laevis]
MRLSLGILSVLSALAATGHSLSCQNCTSASSTSCLGPSVTCAPDNVCAASYILTTADGGPASKIYTLSCAPQSKCDKQGSISIPQAKIKQGISCCFTDNCTPTTPTLPVDSSQQNGLVCRSCISADSTWCYTSDTMQCTGEEKMCILQSTKITGSQSLSTAVRGCATKSICDIGSNSISTPQLSMDVKISCTSGSSGVHQGYIMLLLVPIALMKILY